ncbi:MAG: hypothetical protein WD942_07360 [Dehalococcoidia bacterium]
MVDLEVSGRENIADWIEQTLLARGTVQIGMDGLFEYARAEIGQDEAVVSLAVVVMERRAQILGPGYPFQVFPWAVRAMPVARLAPYSLLLLMTPQTPARRLLNAPLDPLAVAFERIVAEAMRRLLGPSSKALRFGWPGEPGRPPEFYGAIEWLTGEMGIASGKAYRPPRRKDGGVDVVAWRPFPDGRSGFPVMLVQCTLQHDITPKSADIDVRDWAGWLTLDADPATVLAVPGTIPAGEVWNEISLRSLIFERLRLSHLLEGTSLGDIPGCTELVAQQLAGLSGLLAGAET